MWRILPKIGCLLQAWERTDLLLHISVKAFKLPSPKTLKLQYISELTNKHEQTDTEFHAFCFRKPKSASPSWSQGRERASGERKLNPFSWGHFQLKILLRPFFLGGQHLLYIFTGWKSSLDFREGDFGLKKWPEGKRVKAPLLVILKLKLTLPNLPTRKRICNHHKNREEKD